MIELLTANTPNGKKISIMLEEIEYKYKVTKINLDKKEQFNPKFKNIDAQLPVGESLKDVIDRLMPFFNDYLESIKESSGNHLIVAHSNSLRAIVKTLDKLSKE